METLVIYAQERKTRSSYAFAREGRPGNPRSLHPLNFVPTASIKMKPGTAALLAQSDPHAISDLQRELHRAGIRGKTVQVRHARGGVGGGRGSFSVKAGVRSGQISTEGRGFAVLVKNLEV